MIPVPDISYFSYNLFSLLAINATEPNILVSPFSVASALGLVLAGATINATSQLELNRLLNTTSHFDLPLLSDTVLAPSSLDPAVTFNSANGVWSRDLRPSYISTIKTNHSAEAADLPTTYEPIDAYITEKTDGMISDMLKGPIDPSVVAVLVNAIYFKSEWAVKFDSSLTTNGTFTTVTGEERDAMFMHAEREMAVATDVGELQGGDILRLDYGEGNEYAAFFILPANNTNESMSGVITSLAELSSKSPDKASLGDVFNQMSNRRKVALKLPRFKVEYGVRSIKEELRSLGVNEIFDGEEVLMEMSDDPLVHVDDVMHKAVMEVTEEGTEASAATVIIVRKSMYFPSIPLEFDRPFMMLILHTPTQTPLFVARIDDPVLSF